MLDRDVARVLALELLAAGWSAHRVAREVGWSVNSVTRWASLVGMRFKTKCLGGGGLVGSWPPQRESRYRLDLAARVLIRARLSDGWSQARIAAELGVARSTVSREVRRGVQPKAWGDGYNPGWADKRAETARRRPRPSKLVTNLELRAVVLAGLRARLSPQQIAARLVIDYPDRDDMRVSHETIYQALYVQGRGSLRHELTVVKALRSGRKGRKPQSRLPARSLKPWLDGCHISNRPTQVEDRAVPGHWEGDLVLSSTVSRTTGVITLVERHTRFALISRLPDSRDSATVVDKLTAMIGDLPAQLRRSLTWDQGSEMAQHARFTIATGCPVYFCDPHSPWQRGSNENLNGLIRDFYPKGTNFARVTDEEIAEMQHLLNIRPRQTLDWRTPAEKMNELLVAFTT